MFAGSTRTARLSSTVRPIGAAGYWHRCQARRGTSAWKLQQEPERREDDSLVIATATGEPLSASNFLSRDFRPGLSGQGCRG